MFEEYEGIARFFSLNVGQVLHQGCDKGLKALAVKSCRRSYLPPTGDVDHDILRFAGRK